jgi:Synergist-CTERM protein sorting domain-containing protein
MYGVKPMRVVQKIGRGFGRTPYPRQFGHPMRFDGHFVTGLYDSAADGIVAATGAQGGDNAFIIGSGIPDFVFWQCWMTKFRLYKRHVKWTNFVRERFLKVVGGFTWMALLALLPADGFYRRSNQQ